MYLCVQELKENNIPLENVRICYSPFSRTTHTAKVVASVLNLPFEGPQCKVDYSIIIKTYLIEIKLVFVDHKCKRSHYTVKFCSQYFEYSVAHGPWLRW